jgi:hypothetical protein
VLRLMENFHQHQVEQAVAEALRLGAISFDAVKMLLLARLENILGLILLVGSIRDALLGVVMIAKAFIISIVSTGTRRFLGPSSMSAFQPRSGAKRTKPMSARGRGVGRAQWR